MKYFLLLCLLGITGNAISQDSTIALTEFEIFSTKAGKLLRTETTRIGNVGNLSIIRVKAADVNSGESVSAVKISYDYSSTHTAINTQEICIDLEELDPIINALDLFLKEAENMKPTNQLANSYITTNDVEISGYYLPFLAEWRFAIARLYQNLRTNVVASTHRFNRRRAKELLDLLIKSKNTL